MFAIITNILEPLSYSVDLLVVLLHFKFQPTRKTKVLICFYLMAAIIMIYSSYLAQQELVNTYIYNNLLLPSSLILLNYYFVLIIPTKAKRRIIISILVLNLLILISRKIWLNDNNFFDSVGFATLSISIVICCFLYFQYKLDNITEKVIYASFDFWVVCSLFISYSGSFFVFTTYAYLTSKISAETNDNATYLLTLIWGIPNILLFFGSIFILTGHIWIRYSRKL